MADLTSSLAVTVLPLLAKELALSFSQLVQKIPNISQKKLKERESLNEAQVKAVMKDLAAHNLVKVRELGHGDEVIYSITADGVKELEKTTRKGIVIPS